MNYHQYYPIDVVNCLGTRCTLFVSRYIHKHKAVTWKPDSGKLFYDEMENQIITYL